MTASSPPMPDAFLSRPDDAARADAEARRAAARRAARRHSALVRALRRGMVGGGLAAAAAVVGFSVYNPFARGVAGVSVEGAAIEGTKVTMTNPRLSGVQKDGRPYAIEASRAVQDVKAPTLFELHDLKARFTMADRSVTRLTAQAGGYNSAAETMTLRAGVHVVGDSGLEVTTGSALVEFKTSALTAPEPVAVTMPGRRIAADSMRITDGGATVSFAGHVHTEMSPEARTEAAGAAAPGPAP